MSILFHCRAYPDEKGIETGYTSFSVRNMTLELQSLSRWKGNWNVNTSQLSETNVSILQSLIAEPIPMKRELKQTREEAIREGIELQSLSRWKGNWNACGSQCPIRFDVALQSLSRWKGNWNPETSHASLILLLIAEPIPMKRELKLICLAKECPNSVSHCRAYPDEKGIETKW